MKKGLSRSFSKEKAGILEAMLLGEKGNMDKEDTLLFQILGCSHILAISGVCFLCWVFLIGERMA